MKSNRPSHAHARAPEKLDRKPINKPLGFTQPPSIRDQVMQAIRYHTELARTNQAESFEEADDFTDDEIPEFGPGHELPDDVVSLGRWSEAHQRSEALRQAEERLATIPKQVSPGGKPEPADGPPAIPAAKTA